MSINHEQLSLRRHLQRPRGVPDARRPHRNDPDRLPAAGRPDRASEHLAARADGPSRHPESGPPGPGAQRPHQLALLPSHPDRAASHPLDPDILDSDPIDAEAELCASAHFNRSA